MKIVRVENGFSLIELLTVLLITGILVTLAYPSYQARVLRLHRADAVHDLHLAQLNLEKCFRRNHDYSAACPEAHIAGNAYYKFSFDILKPAHYQLSAHAIGPQIADAQCLVLVIDDLHSQASCN